MALSLDYNTLNDIPKPDLPYTKGYEFSVIEHFPPEPHIKSFNLTPDEAAKRETIDVLTRALTRKPIPGQQGSKRLRLKICDTIRVGDGKTSQIVLVDVISGELSKTHIVAKLYDPLYYDHSNDDVDPFIFIDVEYTRENAAYRYLHGKKQNGIPDFYGSYSMDIRYSDHQSRTVRLILLEYISGDFMTTLDPNNFCDRFWKTVMKQIVDLESQLYKINLRHGDVHPRNVIIKNHDIKLAEPGVIFIDFGFASIGRSPNPQNNIYEKKFLPGVYISPLLRWFKARGREPICNFENWITWDWNGWLLGNYLFDKENITPEMIRKWLPPSMRQQFQSLIESS
ncbi:hypothetical protein BO94DRAFT_504973 [Aspergillus sclerotioniger CBS 115572]|uniref:Protein kinase domain-containing protein n=1 Tax=Aspergillus sclerotioniger CBS 115572 TaxID=1450535 RepID=A0A317UUC5_9EURO|nr:hypothetical protein BO94DRAFT_504973 [Aspergillus sclerotioniger CBS 115572]PWY64966.1 hypothetical protein BO94DRAFT_504973 [Aspergillus sclerotioniger CBS 115572]